MRADCAAHLRAVNPWLSLPEEQGRSLLRSRYVPATYVARSASPPPTPEGRAVMVVGPRQAGKSNLAWRHLEPCFPHVLLLNAEEVLVREACSSPALLAEHVRVHHPSVRAVFLEEAQHLEEAGLELKASTLRRPELTRSSRSFIDAYHPRRFAVLNLGLHGHVEVVGDTSVTYLTPQILNEWLDDVFDPR